MGKSNAMKLDWFSPFGKSLSKLQNGIIERLTDARKKKKVSLRTMSEKICIDPSTLSKLERHDKKYLPFQMIAGYSHVLGIPLEKIIFPEEEKQEVKKISPKLEKAISDNLTEFNQELLAVLIEDFAEHTRNEASKQSNQ